MTQEQTLNDNQVTTFREVPGFHLNSGTPCECGAEHQNTRKEVGYSDFVTYYHTCSLCNNEFSTYIEG